MKLHKPKFSSDSDYVQLYAAIPNGHVIKTNKGEYICTCPSLLDECEHIIEFKKEEAKGNI
jgi:hypothetical protein